MEKGRKILFVLLFAILCLPYLQQRFRVIDSGPLRGFYTTSDYVGLTWKGWFDGSYQAGKNNFYNDRIGFRQDLVRLNAQINFSFFRKLEYASSVVDKNGSLIASLIVNSYYGKDFLGYDSILRKVIMLKALQDTFGKMGKSLILVHTPCKAFYNAEEMGELMGGVPRKPNNFQTFFAVWRFVGPSPGELKCVVCVNEGPKQRIGFFEAGSALDCIWFHLKGR